MMRKERWTPTTDFTIDAKSAEEIVIKFRATKTERNVLIAVFVLLGMGAQLGIGYAISISKNITMGATWGLILGVSMFWGLAGLVYWIAKHVPLPEALIVSKSVGTLMKISWYPFREEKKIQSVAIREIEKIYIHEISGENGVSCRLVALMHDGQRVNLHTNPHFETINLLDTVIKGFLSN